MLFESERRTLSAAHSSTMRGSGDHHSGGCPFEYHGKMPRRYASSSRSSDRSPPAASSPFGFFSARSTGGKGSPLSSQASTASSTPDLLSTVIIERLDRAGTGDGKLWAGMLYCQLELVFLEELVEHLAAEGAYGM